VVGCSRVITPGNMVVLFDDQSTSLASILPYSVEFRLVDVTGMPFNNHATQILDFTAGEVRFPGAIPSVAATAYSNWQRVSFNH